MFASGAMADTRPDSKPWWTIAVSLLVLIGILMLLWVTRVPSAAVVWPRFAAMLVLAWALPGALLVALWRLPDLDLPTAGVLAAGLGLCWLVLGVLLANWWPGVIRLPALIGLYATADLALVGALLLRHPRPLQPTPRTRWAWLLGLLVLAAVLRLPGLGYHEFHYDEVAVLTRAREAIRGEDDAFARHTKGPGELAVATVVYDVLGTADETTARLPFALAGMLAVPALALLALRLFDDRTAFWSGVLFAVNGFALGLTRIAQYQAMILLLMSLAVLAMWEFARRGHPRWLVAAAAFSAFGVIMHYEFVLIAPALLWLLWIGWQRSVRSPASTVLRVGAAGGALVAAVYIPMYLNPFFTTTQSYISSRLGSPGRTFNLAFFGEMGTFYNSTYYFVGLIALVLAGLWLTRRQRAQWMTLLLWFVPYLLLYLFIIEFPGTHWYIFMPAWSILAAVPIVRYTSPTVRPVARWSVAALVFLWLAVSANYLHLMFFRQDPEYLVNYATVRAPFYWAPYGENVPEKPRFGLPIYQGWKTLGVLSEWKALGGTYASNERSRHLRWYLGDLERADFDANPDMIFVATHLQEPDPAFSDAQLAGYAQIGDVRVRGEPRIQIWSRHQLPVPFVSYDAETFDAMFMGQAPTFEEWPDPAPAAIGARLGDTLKLVHAGAAPRTAAPGDILHLNFHWLPLAQLPTDYKLFVHVANADGVPLAQWDGYPRWNTSRTSTWTPQEELEDHLLLPLPDDFAPGNYRLLVGMYDPVTGARVGDRTVYVGMLTVR